MLKLSIESIGKACDIKINEPAEERINIILGGHLLARNDKIFKYRYIVYQLEQLSSFEGVWSSDIKSFLSNAFEVWDYSVENIEFLHKHGIKAKYLPIGYHSGLCRVPVVNNKDVDILFYGSLCDRRKKIIETLAADPSIRLKYLFGVYGEKRDEWIARSKIILNIHFYSAAIFEAVRISYLLNNGCFVLSEESPVNPYPGIDLCTAPYEELADKAKYYLKNPEEMEKLRIKSHDRFKQLFPMVELLKKVIK